MAVPHDWSSYDCVVSLHVEHTPRDQKMFRAHAPPEECRCDVIAALKVQDSEEKRVNREIPRFRSRFGYC